MGERWSGEEHVCPYCPRQEEGSAPPEIHSSFLDNKRRRFSFAYMKDQAHISLSDFREAQIAGRTIDDPVHLLVAYSKAQTLFRISAAEAASDWLWACLRATRDYRKAASTKRRK